MIGLFLLFFLVMLQTVLSACVSMHPVQAKKGCYCPVPLFLNSEPPTFFKEPENERSLDSTELWCANDGRDQTYTDR